MPTSIKNAVGHPVVSDLVKIVGRGKIVIFIKVELIKLCERISVSNKLNVEQLEFIATQLVEFFPNESLADFKLCFERGCIGQYGEIYRMDGIVIRKWMEQYLFEKYEIVETNLKEEKNEVVQVESTGPGYEEFKVWAASLAEKKTIRPITEKEIRTEGQEQPLSKKGHFYPSTPLSELEKKELHLMYIRENYDPKTGKELPEWVPETEWLNGN